MNDEPRADICSCTCGLAGCVSRQGRYGGRKAGITSHGTKNGYANGCRCVPCTRASTAKTVSQRKALNQTLRPHASKSGQQWTSAELEVATREDLTATEAARLLGRTQYAVKNIRGKCRTDPKFIGLLGASTSLDRGLADAATGRTTALSFAQYADDFGD